MCKFSNPGTIRVTQDINSDPRVSASRYFKSVPQGLVSIKGKGEMELYDICLNRISFSQRRASLRPAVTKTRSIPRPKTESVESPVPARVPSDQSPPSPAGSLWASPRIASIHPAVTMTASLPRTASEQPAADSTESGGASGPPFPDPSPPLNPKSGEPSEPPFPDAAVRTDERKLSKDRSYKDLRIRQEDTQLQAWLKKKHTISRVLPRFNQKRTESAYQKSKSQIGDRRRGLLIGIFFHLVCCAWQWSVVTWPDHGTIFHHYGNLELNWRMDTAQMMLMVQFIFASASLVFFLAGNISWAIDILRGVLIHYKWISDPEQWTLNDELSARHVMKEPRGALSWQTIRMCELLYALLKIINVGISLGLAFVWPSRLSQGVVFSLYSMGGYGISHTIFGVSFVINLVMAVVSLPVIFLATSLPLQKSMSGLDFAEEHETAFSQWRSSFLIAVTWVIFCSLCASRFLSVHDRKVWIRQQFHHEQVVRLHHLLLDLVPPLYANLLIKGERHIECSPGHVAALQLDICNFTVLSQSLTPTKLADIINSLVSDFDTYVIKHKLTKIDTM